MIGGAGAQRLLDAAPDRVDIEFGLRWRFRVAEPTEQLLQTS